MSVAGNYIYTFALSNVYKAIVQKYSYADYGSAIVYGYTFTPIFYCKIDKKVYKYNLALGNAIQI